METLKVINKELETTKDALLYDRDTLLSYAKDLGYGEEEERFIRIVGLGNTKKQRTSPGQAVLTVPPEFIPDQTLKIIALCAGLTVFLCLAIFGLLRFLQEKNE
ncbi:MAG: septum formation initiator family protein, partial [Treponema sp.]|jgi:hypothetical protein|nr:septum formation initiator family protein [Treponema sp.]